MTVDVWSNPQDTLADRAGGAVRYALIVVVWMALVAGPPIVGGVLGHLSTHEPSWSQAMTVDLDPAPPLISRQEIEAVGLDPEQLGALLTQ
jgi:hypothetical protein